MDKSSQFKKIAFLLVNMLFGCLGPLVRAIGMPSAVTAWLRAWIAAAALVLFIVVRRYRVDKAALKRTFVPLILSGVLIATDWIGLFTAYNYTSIATATLSYYTMPALVFLLSPLVLREQFTAKHAICAAVSFVGMFLVSGVLEAGFSFAELKGVFFALMGAVSYTGVVLINKKYPSGDSLVRTTVQLSVAALVTTPYILLSYDVSALTFSTKSVLLLLLLGIALTAVAYIIYFFLVVRLPARTVAIFCYADPVVAVLISVFFLSEGITVAGIIGAVLIIGASIVSEF